VICPFLTMCQKKVTIQDYMDRCASPDKAGYLDCDEYKRLSKETKTPLEWARSITIPR